MTRALAVPLALLALAAACQPVRGGVFSVWTRKKTMIEQFDQLNNELVNHVDEGESAIFNLLEALEWLKMATNQIATKAYLNLPSRDALALFTRLLELTDPGVPNCGMLAHRILTENERATGTEVLVPNGNQKALRRVELVIFEVALAHAKQCRSEYPHLFESARRRHPREVMDDIQRFLDPIIETSTQIILRPKKRVIDERQVAARKAKTVSIEGYEEADALLKELRAITRDDPMNSFLLLRADPRRRRHWVVDERKVVELMQRYIYSRCEFLIATYEHILLPAKLDQQLYTEETKYRAINERTAELMIWLQYYRLCSDMMDEKKRTKLEDNVIKVIWSEM